MKKISLVALLLSNLCSLHAAAHEEKTQSTPVSTFSYTTSLAAATAVIAGGYALASYTGILPSQLPSAAPLISKIKEFCTENPKRAYLMGMSATAATYLAYKAIYEFRALRVIYALPPYDEPYPAFPTKSERLEMAAFSITRREDQELVNFELPPQTPSYTRLESMLYHEESIPLYARDIIRQAVHEVGISEPIFFYQTTMSCHGPSYPFNRIGLHPRTLAVLNPENRQLFERASLPWATDFLRSKNSFFRSIYHELCHIKEQHCRKHMKLREILLKKYPNLSAIRFPSAPPIAADGVYGRFQELEAELGAIYYLKRCLNWTPDPSYLHDQEDGIHPKKEDQLRYNRLLLQQLDANPNADYAIVNQLAKAYLIEKEPWFADFFALNGDDILKVNAITTSSSSSMS